MWTSLILRLQHHLWCDIHIYRWPQGCGNSRCWERIPHAACKPTGTCPRLTHPSPGNLTFRQSVKTQRRGENKYALVRQRTQRILSTVGKYNPSAMLDMAQLNFQPCSCPDEGLVKATVLCSEGSTAVSQNPASSRRTATTMRQKETSGSLPFASPVDRDQTTMEPLPRASLPPVRAEQLQWGQRGPGVGLGTQESRALTVSHGDPPERPRGDIPNSRCPEEMSRRGSSETAKVGTRDGDPRRNRQRRGQRRSPRPMRTPV
ncbi:hypothetical protein HJG60_008467 [Phyllostomus discolor]|uniref:Uncharacterized protein n=1 Tax=Phyllostomus discolor TaxID=89673 RepID=A0A834DQG2_9CHIR|nr:hypothetical protein HJG60_008467 [Phyllostomus discolor]